MLRIERCLIDANWGQSTDVVYQFCRQSAHAAIVMPSHGRFVGASSHAVLRVQAASRATGSGHNWRIPNVHGKRAVRHVVYDTNYWKSFVHARLAVAMGDRGCLSLFGDNPDQHRLLAEHLTAEYRVKTEGRGRTVDEWKLRPERSDNHWFDCLVGCCRGGVDAGRVAAGIGPGGHGPAPEGDQRVTQSVALLTARIHEGREDHEGVADPPAGRPEVPEVRLSALPRRADHAHAGLHDPAVPRVPQLRSGNGYV